MSSTFASLGVPSDIAKSLELRAITDPFAIQAATLPDALAGRDVCGRAATGSGKTLAFGIPIVLRIGKAKPRRPLGLVLAPTRELAAQIASELNLLGSKRGCRVATFYGGVGYGPQLDALRRGVDIAVACPGRLSDLVERGAMSLRDVEVVVIDEADRMADMGFMPVVRKLLDGVSPDRQTLLFSATLDGDVEELIRRYQKNPCTHEVTTGTAEKGRQSHHFWRSDQSGRVDLITEIVASYSSAMVFCRTKHGVDRLARQLDRAGIKAAPLHGDRTQRQRDQALDAFKSGRIKVLVGTDVAARGLHIDDVGCVIHFDPPEDEKAYVHRSGRTGRAGANGVVFSLVTDERASFVRKLQANLGMNVGIHPPHSKIVSLEGDVATATVQSSRKPPRDGRFDAHPREALGRRNALSPRPRKSTLRGRPRSDRPGQSVTMRVPRRPSQGQVAR